MLLVRDWGRGNDPKTSVCALGNRQKRLRNTSLCSIAILQTAAQKKQLSYLCTMFECIHVHVVSPELAIVVALQSST